MFYIMGWVLAVLLLGLTGVYLWSWWRPEQDISRVATGVMALVFLLGVGYLLGYWWNDFQDLRLHEVFVSYAISVMAIFLVVSQMDRLRLLGLLVSPLVFGILVMGMVAFPVDTAPVGSVQGTVHPSGISHVLLLCVGYGGLTISFLCSVWYIWIDRKLQASRMDETMVQSPSLEDLDHGLYRSLAIGLGFLWAGLIVGGLHAIWIGKFGVNLLKDPNVLGTVLAGLVFGTIFIIRKQSLFTNRRIVQLSATGFVLIMLMFGLMNFLQRAHLFVDL